MTDLTKQFLVDAGGIGIDCLGICRADDSLTFPVFERWLDENKHGRFTPSNAGENHVSSMESPLAYSFGMTYLERHREARRHPRSVLPGVQSLVVFGVSYEEINAMNLPCDSVAPFSQERDSGVIVEYARGADYHHTVRKLGELLAQKHREFFPKSRTRIAVDTAPILEREYAIRAGFGWVGKNTMLINDMFGSRFVLGILLSTASLPPLTPTIDARFRQSVSVQNDFSFCGSCRRCLDICPVGAIDPPYQLDAGKCLNYWLIEYPGDDIPRMVARKIGNRLFGCEECQKVCPYNQKNVAKSQGRTLNGCTTCQPCEKFRPRATPSSITPQQLHGDLYRQLKAGRMSLDDIEALDETSFATIFHDTALERLGLDRLKRNAKIVRRNLAGGQ